MIISTYLKGNFTIDVISIGLPFGLDQVLSKAFFSDQSSRNMLFRVLSMLNFVKVLRIFRLNVLVFRLFKFKPMDMKWVQLVRLLMCLLVFAHVMACAFVMVGTDPTGFPLREGWILKTNPKSFDASNHHMLYLKSMYFSLATLTTVGCGDVHAVTTAERIYATFTVIVGAVMRAAIMGSVVTIFDIIFIDRREKRMHKLESMIRWTKMVRLDESDGSRAVNAMKLCHESEEIGNHWLNRLTTTARSVTRDAAYRRVLDTNLAFASLDLSLRRALAQGMELQVCVEGMNIIEENDLGRFLYVIHRGQCAVIQRSGMVLKNLYKGDTCGFASALIPGLRETFSTRVVSDECYLYSISSEYLRDVTRHVQSKTMLRTLLNDSSEIMNVSVGSSSGTIGDDEEKNEEIEKKRYISLVITVTSANGLRSVDDISDPFVRLSIGNINKRTNVMFDTENPIWNETFYVTNIEESVFRKESLFFSVIDDDAMGSKTNLGVCVVSCEELFQEKRDVIRMTLPLINELPEDIMAKQSKRKSISKKLSWARTRKISSVTGHLCVRFSVRKSSQDTISSQRKKLNEKALKSFYDGLVE